MDVGALTPPLLGIRGTQDLMIFYERAFRCAVCHGRLFPPRWGHQDLAAALLLTILKTWSHKFLSGFMGRRGPAADRKSDFQTA